VSKKLDATLFFLMVSSPIWILYGCSPVLGPTTVEARTDQYVVLTEETAPGRWRDLGVLRICPGETAYSHGGEPIREIAVSADLPCPK
jgi:hypothetical protein